MSYQLPRLLDARNNILRIEHPDLPAYPTTAAASSSAAAVTQTVGDNLGFANNDYIVLGETGRDRTELVTVNGAVTRGTSLTTTATSFDHPTDTPVRLSLWNQVEISGAATVAGAKTVITTVSISWGIPETVYVVSGTTYSFYFARFKNSGSGAFSAYSDAVPAAGYAADTVRSVKKTALNLTGETTGDVITDDFLNTEVLNCDVDLWKEKRRWAMFDVNDFALGTLAPGDVSWNLPSDISDPDTNESIRSVRVRQVGALRFVEREEFDGLRWDVALTTLSSTANIGDTTLSLTDAADFASSGSVMIQTETITYSGKTGNTLTGVPASGTGSIAIQHASGKNVWQGNQITEAPVVYAIMDQAVNIVIPASSTYQNQNIYCSYYSKPTYPDSDADLVNWPDPELYHFWLAWKITLRRHDGTPTDASINFKNLFDARKKLMLSRARLQDKPKFLPERRVSRQNIAALSAEDFISWIIG